MPAAQTTHRATRENGPSVINGRLIWTSASGITTADPHSYGGCTRRWYYEHVEGKKPPETKAQRAGTDLHSEIEDHLRTGVSLTSPLALAGRMFIPQPGGNLFIEKPIHFTTRVGVDIYGHVDLYNLRQQFQAPDGSLQQDPPWSFEVKDWKTTADFQYAKTERELAENIQLTTYAEAGFRLWPDLEHARLTHVYFRTDPRKVPESKLVTIRRSREEIGARWEYAESVVRVMADVAHAPSANHVPANRKSCDAYRGCPHAAYCSEYGKTSLDSLYARIADDFIKEPAQMGILASNPHLMQNAQPMQQPAAPAQPDMRAQLAAEEQQMRAQVTAQQTAPAFSTQALAATCARIMAHGRGFPAIGGNAAQPYSMTLGLQQPVQPGYNFSGQGQLGSIQLTEIAHIFQLADELDAQRAQQPVQVAAQQLAVQPPVQQVQPPPTAQISTQPQNFQAQLAQAYVQQTGVQAAQVQVAPSFLPPDAPVSMPQLAAAQPRPVTEAVQDDGAEMRRTPNRGRPKKSKDAAPESAEGSASAQIAASSAPPPPPAPATQVAPVAVSPSVETCHILVNARFSSRPTKSLAGYVDYINTELAKRYSVTSDGKPGIQDVRCVPKESPLAFGGWKGAVREVVKADPPPPGDYHLDTFLDDLNEAVADALRVVAEAKGWTYVRGVR